MANIRKAEYDPCYPYRIEDSWGGLVCCDKETLKEIKEEIEKILEEI